MYTGKLTTEYELCLFHEKDSVLVTLCCLFSESVRSLVYVFDWQLQEEVDGLADRVELANNALKGDWSRWQNSMRTDLKSAFISTTEKNIEFYEKVSRKFKPNNFKILLQNLIKMFLSIDQCLDS